MIDLSKVKTITIPEGSVKKIEFNGIILWKDNLADPSTSSIIGKAIIGKAVIGNQ